MLLVYIFIKISKNAQYYVGTKTAFIMKNTFFTTYFRNVEKIQKHICYSRL